MLDHLQPGQLGGIVVEEHGPGDRVGLESVETRDARQFPLDRPAERIPPQQHLITEP